MQQEKLVAGLSPALRRLFRAIEQHGPLGAPDLHRDLPLNGDGEWTGRRDGIKEIERLQEKGLVRQTGTKPGRGPAARQYAVVPEEEIEKAAKKYASTKPKVRKRDTTGAARDIAEYRRIEKTAGPSARRYWIEKRRRIVELGVVARQVTNDGMAYWSKDSVPDDELERVYDQALLTLASLKLLVSQVDTQRGDRQLREKIKALLAKADSSEFPGEADSFRAKARELESGL